MAKKKHEHGPLYEHVKRELELAGLSNPKGQSDQTLYSTVLRLADTFERGAKNEFLSTTIKNVFNALTDGELLTNPTDDPDEWKLMPGLGAGVMVNRRCNQFGSRDGGVTWYRLNNPEITGVSNESTKEEEKSDGEESTEKVQPAES